MNKTMNQKLGKFIGLLLIASSFISGWLLLGMKSFMRTSLNVETQETYVIPLGTNFKQVANGLVTRGIIDSPLYFQAYARWYGLAEQIKAGEYLIDNTITASDLLNDFVEARVVQYPLTLIEGWTFRQMLLAINSHEKITHTLAGLSDAEIMTKIGRAGEHPEGRFFPDTYYISGGITDTALLKQAYQKMEKQLQAAWQQRDPDLPFKTPYEALIIASIIEKETAVVDEYPLIAGVFVRRLIKKMRLQTDPTVIYGLGERFDGDIKRRDLRSQSPYNTYRHRGLPPTPIAMPGALALQASVKPAEGTSLYFVASGGGRHHFSDTLAEHNKAVRDYLRRMRQTR